jgi:hypothetical protein
MSSQASFVIIIHFLSIDSLPTVPANSFVGPLYRMKYSNASPVLLLGSLPSRALVQLSSALGWSDSAPDCGDTAAST